MEKARCVETPVTSALLIRCFGYLRPQRDDCLLFAGRLRRASYDSTLDHQVVREAVELKLEPKHSFASPRCCKLSFVPVLGCQNNYIFILFRTPPPSCEMHVPIIFLDLNCKYFFTRMSSCSVCMSFVRLGHHDG